MTDQDMKEVLKQALKEWLDEKFVTVGKWSMAGLAALTLSAIVVLILQYGGIK